MYIGGGRGGGAGGGISHSDVGGLIVFNRVETGGLLSLKPSVKNWVLWGKPASCVTGQIIWLLLRIFEYYYSEKLIIISQNIWLLLLRIFDNYFSEYLITITQNI